MQIQQEPLLSTVLKGLDNARGSWPAVAKATGIPYQTITKIGGRFVSDPRLSTVQALLDYFAGLPEQTTAADCSRTAD